MRLGDLDQLMDQVVRKKADWNNRKYMEGFNDCILRVRSMIHSAKTIDPESLPIVQQLRAELAQMKAERDAAVKDLLRAAKGCDICVLCVHCCEDGKPKYRSDEPYMAFCKECDNNYSRFVWCSPQKEEEQCDVK